MKSIAGGLIIIGLVTSITYALAGTPSKPAAAGGQAGARKKVVNTVFPQLEQYDDLRGLAAGSDAVVVGVPVSHTNGLSASTQDFVWTYNRVKVLSVLKGEVEPGKLVVVRTMGGSAVQANGTEVETKMPDFWKNPVEGQGYVLFLSKRGASRQFEVTGGPQGLFLISPWKDEAAGGLSLTADQLVVPQARAADKLTKSYAGLSAADFLGRLRATVETGAEGK
jgi:hypothetical protein